MHWSASVLLEGSGRAMRASRLCSRLTFSPTMPPCQMYRCAHALPFGVRKHALQG